MNKWIAIFVSCVIATIASVVLAVINSIIWNSGFLGFVLGFGFTGFGLMSFISYGLWEDD